MDELKPSRDPAPRERESERPTTEPGPSVATGREAIRGSLWTLLSTGVGLPLGVASVAISARYLGVSGFGLYAFYSFVIPIGLAALDLGMGSQLHWAATSGRAAHAGEAVEAIRATTTWNLIKLPLIAVGSFALFGWHTGPAIALAVLLGAAVLTEALAQGLSADRNFRAMSQSSVIGSFASSVSVAILAVATRSPQWTAAGFYASRLVSAPYLVLAVAPDLRRAAFNPGPVRIDRRGIRFGLSSYGTTLLSTWVFGRSELIFLKAYAKPIATGRFGLVTTVAQRATLLADALYGAMGISLIALQRTNPDRMPVVIGRAIRVASGVAIATALVGLPAVTILAGPVLGPRYGDIVLPTGVLLAAALCKTASEPLSAIVFARRSVAGTIVPGLVAAVIDTALAASLIPFIGLTGAVLASAAATLTYLLATARFAGLPREAIREYVQRLGRLALVVVPGIALSMIHMSLGPAARAVGVTALNLVLWVLVSRMLTPILTSEDVSRVISSLPAAMRPLVRLPMQLLTLGAR